MARLLAFLSLATLAIGLAGCQERPAVDRYPNASFQGPLSEVRPSAPVTVNPIPIQPPRVIPIPIKPQPPVVQGHREWVPLARANSWNWIVIHHSATGTGGARAFDRMHREKGWDELGYHFVIGNGTDTSDGQIEVGPRWLKQKWGAHTKTPDNRFNEHGIGICLVGNFDTQRPTRAQMASLTRLVAYLQKTYNVPSNSIMGHRDAKPTDCPGHNMNVAELRRLAARLASTTAPEPTPRAAQPAGAEMLVDVKR